MKNALILAKGEYDKLLSQRKYMVLLIIAGLIVIGGALLGIIPGNIVSFTMTNYQYMALSMISYIFAPMAIFMMASDLFSGEIETSQIKVVLTRPIARYKVLLAKTLAMICFVCLLLALAFALSSVFVVIFAGIAELSVITSILAYAIALVSLIPIIAMAVMISTLAKSSTMCFSVCLLSYVGFIVLGFVFPNIAPVLFTSYIGTYGMVIGSSVPMGNLLTGITISLSFALTFISAGGLIFANKEF